jgi:hypothetical protein
VLRPAESARPFVPARDVEVSKRFYARLGFEKVLDGDVAVFRIGTSSFILTPFHPIENFMMQLMVDDLDAWWTCIVSGALWHIAERRPGAPQDG